MRLTSFDEDLASAYAHVEQRVVARSHSFRLATGLLAPAQRQALWTAYLFFRVLDDWVDTGAVSEAELDAYARQALRPAEEQNDPLLMAWADVRRRYAVDLGLVAQLIDGIKRDLRPTELATLADLEAYCAAVAGVPGCLVLPILGTAAGVAVAQAEPYALQLAQALQTTDILIDVVEDEAHDRVYVPRELLSRHGASRSSIRERTPSPAWRAAMRELVGWNRRAYQAAWPGTALLATPGRWAVRLGALTLLAYLARLEALNFDNLTRPIVLTRRQRLAYAFRNIRSLAGNTLMLATGPHDQHPE